MTPKSICKIKEILLIRICYYLVITAPNSFQVNFLELLPEFSATKSMVNGGVHVWFFKARNYEYMGTLALVIVVKEGEVTTEG